MRPSSLTRRHLLALGAAAIAAPLLPARAADRPVVGAIRWDAWYAPDSAVTQAVARSLAPPQYRWRRPFFAAEQPGEALRMPALSQGLIDLEITQARYAGLDYWAFVAYPSASPMAAPLRHYLASARRGPLRFCTFTELSAWGRREAPSPLPEEHIALMRHDAWQRVGNGRPLYYLGFVSAPLAQQHWGGRDGLRDAIAGFRRRAIAAGAGDPYLVVAVTPRDDTEFAASLGADAVGAYAIADGHARGSYADLVRTAEDGWQRLARAGLPVVPTVMAGWDRRPRIEHPVPWERQRPGVGLDAHYGTADPAGLQAHLRQAISYAQAQPGGRTAPAVLIYAWNENDEGGWLLPTVPCDESRLTALHATLRAEAAEAAPGCALP
jgi:hypothetical protein